MKRISDSLERINIGMYTWPCPYAKKYADPLFPLFFVKTLLEYHIFQVERKFSKKLQSGVLASNLPIVAFYPTEQYFLAFFPLQFLIVFQKDAIVSNYKVTHI